MAKVHHVNPRSKSPAGTQSVARALSLLDAFTDRTPEWSLSRLAQVAGLNKTTTHRLLGALEEAGYVAHDVEAERYRLGPQAIVLGGRAMRANPVRTVARPELAALARATGETATLEVLAGSDVLIVEDVIPGRVLGGGEVGMLYAAHATGTGKELLAVLESESDLPDELPALTPKTITSREALLAELERARANGWALNVEELERGFAAVGAPVRDGSGRVVAAIGLGGPVTRMDFDTMVEAVVATARRVSAALGAVEAE